MDDARFLHELRRYWDEIARGGPAPPGDLDPEFAAAIQRLHALPDVPPPDPAYAKRLRESLMHATTAPIPWTIGPSLDGHTAPSAPRGLTPALPWPRRPNLAWTQAAVALLLVVAILAAYFSWFRHEDRAYVPGIATPSPEASPAADWPMYRGNPARTGAMSGPGPDGQPVELWRFRAQGPASRSPAIADGVAYLQSDDNTLYALDAVTGAERWRASIERLGENTPAVSGGLVYVNTSDNALIALDAASGKQRWRFAEPVAAGSTPVVVDGVLYAGSDEGNVYAIDAATGGERWRATVDGPIARSLAIGDGLLYAGTGTGHLYALDLPTGATRWQFDSGNESEFIGTPVVVDRTVYAYQDGTLFAFDAATGDEQWRKTYEGARPISPAGGMLISGGLDGIVYAIDAATGEDRWTFTTGDSIQAAPAVVGATVYAASFDRTLYALDAATGQERWAFDIDGAADYGPSVANGIVYVGTDAGSLYAIGGSGMEQLAAPQDASATPATSASPGASASAASASQPVEQLWEYVDPTGQQRAISSISLAPDGNLWILDGNASQFQILSPDGTEVDRWGEPGSGPGQFNFVRDETNAFGSVTFAPDGSFYVADSHNFRIQQFDKNRHFIREWGEFGKGDGQFQEPIQVLIDQGGDVYVIDDKRDDVQKFTADGRFLGTFSGHGSEDGQLSNAGFGAFDVNGNLWIADGDNNRLQLFSPDGELLQIIAGTPGTASALDGPSGLTIDAKGRLFVGDFDSGRVVIYAPDGTFLLALDGSEGGGTGFDGADFLVLDGQGNLYAHDYGARESIQKYRLLAPEIGGTAPVSANAATTPLLTPPAFLWQSTGGPEPMYAVAGVAIDSQGNVWVIDAGNDRIQIFSPDGEFVESWDGAGGGGERFGFKNRDGGGDGDIAFDASGNIYVVEPIGRRVQVFDPERKLLASWGEPGTKDGQFVKPIGIAVDSARNVYVLDNERRDIQKFDRSGAYLATFGDFGEGQLRNAAYLAVDGHDTLWVADGDSNRILAFASDGTFLRQFGATGDGPGQFDEAMDVAVDAAGIVYVADLDHGWVQAFTSEGTLLAVWDAGRTPSGGRNLPYAIALDNQGNLYVAGVGTDHNSDSNIQKFRLPPLAP